MYHSPQAHCKGKCMKLSKGVNVGAQATRPAWRGDANRAGKLPALPEEIRKRERKPRRWFRSLTALEITA